MKQRGHPKKASDEEILDFYRITKSCKLTAQALGMCGQSVHERLVKMGQNNKVNLFTEADQNYLKAHYDAYAMAGKLSDLGKIMGRTKHFICRQAGVLGLTDQSRPRSYIAVWKYMPVDAAQVIWDDFKGSSYGLGAYCQKKGIDDLGFATRMRELFADEWEAVIELKVPQSSMYKLGRAFEYRVRDHLKKNGFFVMRSPASKSPVDLIAYAHGTCLMVQCKRHGSISPKEWNIFYDLCMSIGAKPILASMPDSQRGVAMFEMTGKKDGTPKRQPMVEFTL